MNSVNHGSTCPTIGIASARYTRGLKHEGPGVSISLVGGRNSSIGFIMTSNLSFHAATCRHVQNCALRGVHRPSKMAQWIKRSPQSRSGAFLSNILPDQHLVCAIPRPRATAKMVLCEQSTTALQLQIAVTNLSSGFQSVLCAL